MLMSGRGPTLAPWVPLDFPRVGCSTCDFHGLKFLHTDLAETCCRQLFHDVWGYTLLSRNEVRILLTAACRQDPSACQLAVPWHAQAVHLLVPVSMGWRNMATAAAAHQTSRRPLAMVYGPRRPQLGGKQLHELCECIYSFVR